MFGHQLEFDNKTELFLCSIGISLCLIMMGLLGYEMLDLLLSRKQLSQRVIRQQPRSRDRVYLQIQLDTAISQHQKLMEAKQKEEDEIQAIFQELEQNYLGEIR